jgi:tetratricopeptide (TPR) repeat protein
MTTLPLLASLLVPQVSVDIDPPPILTATAQEPPAWVAEGVPDTVWMLVEATYAEGKTDRSKEMLLEAEAHARAALEGYEDDVGRRFALVVVLGRRADVEGGRARVRAASACHEELEAVLERSPEHPQARHLMGRIYAGVRRMGRLTRWIATNLLGGGRLKAATWEAAEAHLVYAEQAKPEVSDHHLQLANLYRDTGRPELALAEARHALAIPVTTPMEMVVHDEAAALEAMLTN